jgi:uncharacterized protein YqjF (DUF2071 family)
MATEQPRPDGPWVMRQTWRDLLFAHWPVPVEMLRSLIPESLVIDTFDGEAWIGVVPFRMTAVRLRGTPYTPFADAFPELNVRTYVLPRGADGEGTGKPGVWFFSLDAGSRLAVQMARWFFHLPYFNAKMQVIEEGDAVHYRSRRTHHGAPPATLVASYHPTGPVTLSRPGTLDHWLTERYCLYAADRHGHIYRGDIHHAHWPLQAAAAEITTNTMAAAHGITLPDTPPLLCFARRLDMQCWFIRRQRAVRSGQREESGR